MTLRELQVIGQAAARRDAHLAWLSAQYHRFAVHDPNDMPDDPAQARAPGTSTQAEIVEAKALMRAMARKAAHGS